MNACHVCGRRVADGATLYRQNEKGVAPIWACAVHRTKPVDPDVQRLIDVIEDDNA